MSYTLRKYMNVIRVISSMKDENVRSAVLRSLKKDREFFKALREIAKNTVKGNIKPNRGQKIRLGKHQHSISRLACSHKNCRDRCKLVVQSGGFLPILIPSVVSLLSTLLKCIVFAR